MADLGTRDVYSDTLVVVYVMCLEVVGNVKILSPTLPPILFTPSSFPLL